MINLCFETDHRSDMFLRNVVDFHWTARHHIPEDGLFRSHTKLWEWEAQLAVCFSWFLAHLTLRPWKWKRYVLPTRWALSELHSVTNHRTIHHSHCSPPLYWAINKKNINYLKYSYLPIAKLRGTIILFSLSKAKLRFLLMLNATCKSALMCWHTQCFGVYFRLQDYNL
jgi:hypothetical protein